MSDIDQSLDKCYYLPRKVGDAMSEKEWLTVKEVAVILKVSERNVRFKIDSGKLKAKRKGRIWLVHSSLSPTDTDTEEIPNGNDGGYHADTEIVDILKQEIEKRDRQLEEKDQQINQQQAIIMQLSRNQQMILESAEQKKSRSWWQRLRNRQQKETD